MNGFYVSKEETSKLLGVSLRMVTNYLQSGRLKAHHKEGKNIMIDLSEVYSLREKNKTRKVGI